MRGHPHDLVETPAVLAYTVECQKELDMSCSKGAP